MRATTAATTRRRRRSAVDPGPSEPVSRRSSSPTTWAAATGSRWSTTTRRRCCSIYRGTDAGKVTRTVSLPDSAWEAEVRVGTHLAANWCNDVIMDPQAETDETWEIVEGTLEFVGEVRRSTARPRTSRRAELTGVVVEEPGRRAGRARRPLPEQRLLGVLRRLTLAGRGGRSATVTRPGTAIRAHGSPPPTWRRRRPPARSPSWSGRRRAPTTGPAPDRGAPAARRTRARPRRQHGHELGNTLPEAQGARYCVFALTYGLAPLAAPFECARGGTIPIQDTAKEFKTLRPHACFRETGAAEVDLVGHSEGALHAAVLP